MLKSKEKQQQNSHTERRRATLMIWAIVFVGVVLCFSSLSSATILNSNAHGITLGSTSAETAREGMVINATADSASWKVVKHPLTTATKCYLAEVFNETTMTPITNVTFIGDNATFTYNFINGSQYIVYVYSDGAGYTRNYNNSVTLPIINETIIWETRAGPTSETAYTTGQTIYDIIDIIMEVPFEINLISPLDNSVITDIGSNFTIEGNDSTTSLFNWTNATYYIWNTTGIFNETYIDFADNESFINTTYIDDFVLGNYHWNANGCYGNSTDYNCTWAADNYTFVVGASISNLTYNSTAYETSKQYFSGILELLPGTDLYDVKVIYNGTEHDGSLKLLGGDKYLAYSSFDINSVSSVTNYSFYFRLIYSLGAGAFLYQNSTEFYQNVYPINFSQCSAGNITLNFSAYNEEDLTSINNFSFYATFEYWLGSGDVRKNFSISNSSVPNNLLFCMNPNLTYYSDAKIQYEKTGYVKRSYYLINSSLTNTTNNIGLYLLNKSVSTSFIINIIDDVQFAVENAYIYIQRYYPGTGLFHTIEMAKTDNSGNTIGHFEAETEDYKVIIFKDGVILYESEMAKVFCGETPCTLNFQTEPAAAITWKNIGDLANLIWSLVYNEATKIWTYTYVDTSGTTNYGRLLVYTDDGNSRIVICNNTDTSSAATLTCNVTDYKGAIYAEAYISRSPEILVWLESIIESTAKAIFGMEGLFWATIILLIIGLIGTWNPSIGIVMMIAGIILISYLQIASFGITTIIGITFIGLLLLWEIKK